ncbi:hypothetical protein [Paenibacillus sinopodophylli]|uniref:hypothetical protein n=1 Tax=Paenibacillus sinopodophylli TaxID=1837342 RepID=UPI00110C9918|nr:hypothetical protein [Paenibacillus sinopodophylli]
MIEEWKQLSSNNAKSHGNGELWYEIEQTIEELETYLEANSEDEIAWVQYKQFLNKRENMNRLLAEAYEGSSHLLLQA